MGCCVMVSAIPALLGLFIKVYGRHVKFDFVGGDLCTHPECDIILINLGACHLVLGSIQDCRIGPGLLASYSDTQPLLPVDGIVAVGVSP